MNAFPFLVEMALKGSRNEVERGKSEDNIIFLKQDIKTVRHKNREGFKKKTKIPYCFYYLGSLFKWLMRQTQKCTN